MKKSIPRLFLHAAWPFLTLSGYAFGMSNTTPPLPEASKSAPATAASTDQQEFERAYQNSGKPDPDTGLESASNDDAETFVRELFATPAQKATTISTEPVAHDEAGVPIYGANNLGPALLQSKARVVVIEADNYQALEIALNGYTASTHDLKQSGFSQVLYADAFDEVDTYRQQAAKITNPVERRDFVTKALRGQDAFQDIANFPEMARQAGLIEHSSALTLMFEAGGLKTAAARQAPDLDKLNSTLNRMFALLPPEPAEAPALSPDEAGRQLIDQLVAAAKDTKSPATQTFIKEAGQMLDEAQGGFINRIAEASKTGRVLLIAEGEIDEADLKKIQARFPAGEVERVKALNCYEDEYSAYVTERAALKKATHKEYINPLGITIPPLAQLEPTLPDAPDETAKTAVASPAKPGKPSVLPRPGI